GRPAFAGGAPGPGRSANPGGAAVSRRASAGRSRHPAEPAPAARTGPVNGRAGPAGSGENRNDDGESSSRAGMHENLRSGRRSVRCSTSNPDPGPPSFTPKADSCLAKKAGGADETYHIPVPGTPRGSTPIGLPTVLSLRPDQ